MDAKLMGARLRDLRGDRSQQEVADAIGVGVMAISNYERGERTPQDDIKIRLAGYYGKTVQEIFFAQK
jgi:transcriptional regulator with XRE-family HTH domain